MTDVVGRLAPSPTGRLHLGHARSFLLAWWSARSQGGRVELRIDDLDATRVKPGAIDLVLEDLAWLGLDWDGDPLFQTTRQEAHTRALEHLTSKGRAYACVCTRKEIEEAASAPHADDTETRYPGTCRDRYTSVEEARRETGRDVALRLRVPAEPVHFTDVRLGAQEVDVSGTAGDFVIARKDGVAAYQFATPMDDDFQGVTEVVRGDDLLASAARQKLICDALELPFPRQVHVSLVHNADGTRLAKRSGALSLQELRAAGVTPMRIARWVAAVSGQPATDEPRPASAWIENFKLGQVSAAPVFLPDDPGSGL